MSHATNNKLYVEKALHTLDSFFFFSIKLGRPYHFKFFKGSLLQILLGPFLNTFDPFNIPCNFQNILTLPAPIPDEEEKLT